MRRTYLRHLALIILLVLIRTSAGAQSFRVLPMHNGRVSYQRQFSPAGYSTAQTELFLRLKSALHQPRFTLTYADPATGTLTGKGFFDIPTNDSGHHYQVNFNWRITVSGSHYSFISDHYYERPLGIGTTSEFSKIEYRWWDFRQGHPWHREDQRLFTGVDSAMNLAIDDIYKEVNKPRTAPVHPCYRVLAFYSNTVERDHVDFAYDAIRFYADLAARKNFAFDTTSNWENCNDALKKYQVVLWLNDFPQTEAQRTAFQTYMEQGGAWLGFHVAGYNDGTTHWPWFVHFFGDAVFYNNSWPPLPARLIVDDNKHVATHRLPTHYTAPINEWYGWQPSPRRNRNIRVLITLNPNNYPLGKKDIIHGGDIPVAWTNTQYKMLYMNMGHGDQIFSSPIQNRLFEDAVEWLGTTNIR